jgi:hypothetical protein
MELTNEEKQEILNQRLKQFAVEKYNHEINKEIMMAQEKEIDVDVDIESKELVAKDISKTDESIAIIDKAIYITQEMITKLTK